MKAVLQRVSRSKVLVGGEVVGKIGQGFCILLGVAAGDTREEIKKLSSKIAMLRVFSDEAGKMNRSILEIGGEILLISQFTLLADAKKGNRPSFINAAPPEIANSLYEEMKEALLERGVQKVETGVFGADMAVEIENDGPVTIILDTKEI